MKSFLPVVLCLGTAQQGFAATNENLIPASSKTSTRVPRQYPLAGSYNARLETTEKAKICANCSFTGRHHYDSSNDKVYGHVSWVYGKRATPEKRNDFVNIFLGTKKELYIVQTGHGCTKVPNYPKKIFEDDWAKDAKYVGVEWFHNKLCHRFDNVMPYWVQGTPTLSTYYESIFDGMPAGYRSELEHMWYDEWDLRAPDANMFLKISEVECATSENMENPFLMEEPKRGIIEDVIVA